MYSPLTGFALAGIPTIIKPFFGDQFFWADRVEALGIGAAVRKLTVETLAEALREATTNPKLIERAKLVGEQIRAVRLNVSSLPHTLSHYLCRRMALQQPSRPSTATWRTLAS